MIFGGMYDVDTSLFTGKALSHITKNIINSIIIIFVRHYKGSLIMIKRALSLMNLLYVSI